MSDSKGPRDVVPMVWPSEVARRGGIGREAERIKPATPERPDDLPPTLRLHLSKRHETDAPDQVFVFTQPRVTIGRSGSCDLRLTDEHRLASGLHAEIKSTGGRLQIADQGSKNFTLLNGEQLEPHQPRGLRNGDSVEIAELIIRIEVVETGRPNHAEEQTLLSPEYVNPFREDAPALADVLDALTERYGQEHPSRRDAALHEALREVLPDAEQATIEAIRRLVDRSPSSGSTS